MVTSREKLYKIFKEAYDLGYQLACHAIGDKANDIIVGIFKKIQSESKDKNRVRIEHASLINDDTLVEAAKHGIIIVSQPLFINSEYTWLEERLGSKRIKHVYPFRSIIDSGILLAGASDAPIETPDVLRAIYVAVTRNEFVPEQSISVYEGLKMFTYNAAYALGQEDVKGSLEKGKLADFVVLNQDPTSISLEDITKTKILKTYHRGKEIFSLN
jgi:predicted amidohydrolase YtcJ